MEKKRKTTWGAVSEKRKRETGKREREEMGRKERVKRRERKKGEGSKRQPKGFPKSQTLPRELRGALRLPNITLGPLAPLSTFSSHQRRHRLSASHPGCFYFPFPPFLLAKAPLSFLSRPHSHPQPFLVPRALTSPPHAPCFLRSFRQHHQPSPH